MSSWIIHGCGGEDHLILLNLNFSKTINEKSTLRCSAKRDRRSTIKKTISCEAKIPMHPPIPVNLAGRIQSQTQIRPGQEVVPRA
jgi:hypothetical protein